jgi:hypothetical protein
MDMPLRRAFVGDPSSLGVTPRRTQYLDITTKRERERERE